jgi:hypothetical protein
MDRSVRRRVLDIVHDEDANGPVFRPLDLETELLLHGFGKRGPRVSAWDLADAFPTQGFGIEIKNEVKCSI